MSHRPLLTNPVHIADARAARQRELAIDGRRPLLREVRDAIAPDGVLVVEGVRWLVELREDAGGLVRADARCGPFRVHTFAPCPPVERPPVERPPVERAPVERPPVARSTVERSTVERLAAELGPDLLEHIDSVHQQIVEAAAAIGHARRSAGDEYGP